jgi:hypothetical protein
VAKLILLIWVLVGIGVVVYGIKVKSKYGYMSQFNIITLIIMAVSAIVWPYTLVSIIKLIKRDEAIINEVIKENPKYTREDLLRGAEILNDIRLGKWPTQKQ